MVSRDGDELAWGALRGVRLEETQVESGFNITRDCFGWQEVKKRSWCEQILSCAKAEKLLLEDPCVELVKMGCFKDSVPGLTLPFIILRALRWFQH